MSILHIIAALLIMGLLLWAVSQLPWIEDGVKQLIRVIIIVLTVLWLIGVLFGGPILLPLR